MATTGTRRVPLSSVVWREPSRPIDPKHVKELAASIEEVGLLQPIGVVDAGGGKWEGRMGRHRFEAMKSLGEKEIDVQVLDLDDVGRRIATAHENLKRKDLNPMEEARYFKVILDARRAQDAKVTQEAVAKELQVSAGDFSNTLLRLDQDVHVQKLLEDGQLTPGHLEHVIAPLVRSPPKGIDPKAWNQEVVRFAHEIVRQGLDIHTAEGEAEHFRDQTEYQLRREVEEKDHNARQAALDKTVSKVKEAFQVCPKCLGNRGEVMTEAQERKEGLLLVASCGHRWWGTGDKAGELYFTPAELKEMERWAKEKKQARKDAAKKRKGAPAVVREYAVAFLRAPLDKWAKAFQESVVGAGGGVTGIVLDPCRVSLESKKVPFAKSGSARNALNFEEDLDLYFSPVDLPDGRDGKFLTRVQIGSFASSSIRDNVVEDPDGIKAVRKVRADLLAFQASAIGTKQAEDDVMPTKLGGFLLGERVRIAKAGSESYLGKPGAILAFDVDTEILTDKWGHRPNLGDGWTVNAGKELGAVLGISLSDKRHPLAALGKITRWACARCAGKAVVQVTEGKDVRVCVGCGLAEGKCTCKSAAIKGAVPPIPPDSAAAKEIHKLHSKPVRKKGKAPKGRAK